MAKIRGKFAPLTDELGNDERFIIESTDLDKLLYVLIIYTCHMTYHSAPVDAQFYKIRYGLRSKTGQIAASLRRLRDMYPKLSWGDKKLSLLNSPTYKNELGARRRIRIEEEKEEEIEVVEEASRLNDFNKFIEEYPSKASPSRARQFYFQGNQLQIGRLLLAVQNYKKHLEANPWKTAMNPDTFLQEWIDWENYTEPEKKETQDERDARVLARLQRK